MIHYNGNLNGGGRYDYGKATTLKRGLVIQGPLSSRGRSGGTEQIVDYDCLPNIQRIVAEYSNYFDEIVVSTWESSPLASVRKLEKLGVNLVLSDDSHLDYAPGDNRLRMYYSSLVGLRALSSKISVACKVRTDQFFDLGRFFTDYEAANENFRDYEVFDRQGYIQGLFFSLEKPFGLCDFALVGPLHHLTEFYEAQFLPSPNRRESFNDMPEASATKQYLWYSLGDLLARPSVAYSPPHPKTIGVSAISRKKLDERTYRIWEIALRAVFSVASAEIMPSLEWRGAKFAHSEYGFRKEWMHARVDFAGMADGNGLMRFSIRGPWIWRVYEGGKLGRIMFLVGQKIERRFYKLLTVIAPENEFPKRAWALFENSRDDNETDQGHPRL